MAERPIDGGGSATSTSTSTSASASATTTTISTRNSTLALCRVGLPVVSVSLRIQSISGVALLMAAILYIGNFKVACR